MLILVVSKLRLSGMFKFGTIVLDGSSMNPLFQDLAARVRARRKELDLTQQDLADLSRCSPRFVGALEAGKHAVRLDKLVELLDALGLELRVVRRDR